MGPASLLACAIAVGETPVRFATVSRVSCEAARYVRDGVFVPSFAGWATASTLADVLESAAAGAIPPTAAVAATATLS